MALVLDVPLHHRVDSSFAHDVPVDPEKSASLNCYDIGAEIQEILSKVPHGRATAIEVVVTFQHTTAAIQRFSDTFPPNCAQKYLGDHNIVGSIGAGATLELAGLKPGNVFSRAMEPCREIAIRQEAAHMRYVSDPNLIDEEKWWRRPDLCLWVHPVPSLVTVVVHAWYDAPVHREARPASMALQTTADRPVYSCQTHASGIALLTIDKGTVSLEDVIKVGHSLVFGSKKMEPWEHFLASLEFEIFASPCLISFDGIPPEVFKDGKLEVGTSLGDHWRHEHVCRPPPVPNAHQNTSTAGVHSWEHAPATSLEKLAPSPSTMTLLAKCALAHWCSDAKHDVVSKWWMNPTGTISVAALTRDRPLIPFMLKVEFMSAC